jgi:hypothetical protein
MPSAPFVTPRAADFVAYDEGSAGASVLGSAGDPVVVCGAGAGRSVTVPSVLGGLAGAGGPVGAAGEDGVAVVLAAGADFFATGADFVAVAFLAGALVAGALVAGAFFAA